MIRKSKPFRRSLIFLSILSLFVAYFQALPMQLAAQGFLSRLIAIRASSAKASFSYSPSFPTEGQAVQFTDTTTASPTAWQWDFGDGTTSTSQNPSHTYLKAGFKKITLIASNSRSSKKTIRTMTVTPAPATATFVYSPASPAAGQTVQFADTTSGEPTSWQWDFGDGATSTSKNPNHSFLSPSSYTVTLVARNSSGSKRGSQTIAVASTSTLAASFTFSPASPVAGQAVSFTDTSTGSPTSWQWNFGDGTTSTVQNPSHTYATAGTRTVTLTATNSSGSNTATRTVTVVAALAASFSFSPASPVAGQAVSFTDTSTGSPTSWQWNFNDGTTSTVRNPSHTYATTGARTVTLTATNSSGSNTATRTVTVVAALAASFSFSPASPVAGQAVSFTDTSTGSPTSWQWNFGDGSTSTARNPSHEFASSGSYSVALTVMNASGQDDISHIVTVTSAGTLAASFTYSPSSPAAGQVVSFTDTSTGTPTSWQWNFGDGSTSALQNPSHAYSTTGSFSATLIVSNGSGSNTTIQAVTIVAASTIIPSDRLVDWSRAGVWADGVKGIPNRTVIFCNVRVSIPGSSLVAVGDGVQDDTAALRAAISACPAGQVVFIPAGTYRISGTLSISRGIVVRGAGSDQTKIIQHASQNIFYIAGGGSGTTVNITSGYAKGSDTLVVSDGSQFSAGNIVIIDQLNDPSLVTANGAGSLCSYCGLDGTNGTRAMGETLQVKARSGNTITLVRPLYYDYKAAFVPHLTRLTGTPTVNAGIEDLYIEAAAEASDGDGIRMANCAYCWVRNVESYNTAGKHMEIRWGAYGNEVRESYFHHAQNFGSNGGYGIDINNYSTDNLLENNALYYIHTGIVVGSAGGSGNVIAYNYINTTVHWQPWWYQSQLGSHGAHTYMNLWEGNVAGKVDYDNYWGSGSHAVFLRNRITRENPDQPVTMDVVAVVVDANNYYMTFVGNIIGTPGCSGPTEQIPFLSVSNNPVLWKIGYDCCSGTGNPDDANVAATLIRTGNWECTTNAVQWNSSERSIPDSLYLTSKPAWFGVLDWPPFTPERPGFNPNNVNKIPAQVRFENGPAIGLPWATSRGY